MSDEKLELVTRFEDLRAGMLVVIKPCRWCGESHRGMLTSFEIDGLTTHGCFDVWHTTIPSHPGPGPDGIVIAAVVVEHGIIWRVIIPGADKALDMSTGLPQNEVAKNIRALLAARRA